MAFYIKLIKTFEDADAAKYSFGSDPDKCGTLKVDKLTGAISVAVPLEGDEKNHFFNRAAAKIWKEWNEGRYPDMTEWAS